MAEKLLTNICPRFSAVCGGNLIAQCLNQGVGLPRLCGTPCRSIEVSHSLRLRVIPLRHAAVLSNIVSTDPWLTCICFWVFEVRTAPSCAWRQAALRSLSPPTLRLISVSIAGVPRQAHCQFSITKLERAVVMSRLKCTVSHSRLRLPRTLPDLVVASLMPALLIVRKT